MERGRSAGASCRIPVGNRENGRQSAWTVSGSTPRGWETDLPGALGEAEIPPFIIRGSVQYGTVSGALSTAGSSA